MKKPVKIVFVIKDPILGGLFGLINHCLVIDTTEPKGKRIYTSSASWFKHRLDFKWVEV